MPYSYKDFQIGDFVLFKKDITCIGMILSERPKDRHQDRYLYKVFWFNPSFYGYHSEAYLDKLEGIDG